MGRFIDLTGQRFGRLIVLAALGPSARAPFGIEWACRCECGNFTRTESNKLRTGHTVSCGCRKQEARSQLRHGHARGKRGTVEYVAWYNLKQHCLNPKRHDFHLYGGRGIEVCDRWRDSFENFLADMGLKPSPELSLDRIDVNGDYEPGNCRWTTRAEQRRNQRPKATV